MRLKRWWDGIGQALEAHARMQRPWEQEGPLRWCKPPLARWELHGSTLPEHDATTRR